MTVRLIFTILSLPFTGIQAAQTVPVSLAGTISYPDGSPVPHAPIQLKNIATGAVVRTLSKADGRYTLAVVVPGLSQFTIVMPCCAYLQVNKEIALEAGNPAQLNIALVETINGSTLGDDPARLADVMRKRAKVSSGPALRTPAGKPDLSGVWLITDDPYPEDPDPMPWAAALIGERRQNSGKDAPHNHCLPGPPPASGSSAPFIAKFVQTPALI